MAGETRKLLGKTLQTFHHIKYNKAQRLPKGKRNENMSEICFKEQFLD